MDCCGLGLDTDILGGRIGGRIEFSRANMACIIQNERTILHLFFPDDMCPCRALVPWATRVGRDQHLSGGFQLRKCPLSAYEAIMNNSNSPPFLYGRDISVSSPTQYWLYLHAASSQVSHNIPYINNTLAPISSIYTHISSPHSPISYRQIPQHHQYSPLSQ